MEVPCVGTPKAMNQLKVNQQQSIIALFEQGWSKRRIARELGLDRLTVRKRHAEHPLEERIISVVA